MRTALTKHISPLGKRLLWIFPVLAFAAISAPVAPLGSIVPAVLGAIALSAMAASLVIAGRPDWLDRFLGGPDKSYVVHRHAGYVAIFALLVHWAIASSVGAGPIPSLADLGESAGVLAAFGILTFSAIAALRLIPHHIWKATHWLMGPLFAISVFHTFFSASPFPVLTAPWLVLAGVSVVGLWGWYRTLTHRKTHDIAGVSDIAHLSDAIEIELTSEQPMRAFAPGQFQTLTAPTISNEAHPFTIAGGRAQSRKFGIRKSGDWTEEVFDRLSVGDEVVLGKVQGRFMPRIDNKRPAQLWVAGGTGITPFLAALETMKPDINAPITLVYCHRGAESTIGLSTIKAAEVRLPQLTVVWQDTSIAGRITDDVMKDALCALPDRCDLFTCGPDGLKQQAAAQFVEACKRGRMHHEEFDFRGAWGLGDLTKLSKTFGQSVQGVAQFLSGLTRTVIRYVQLVSGVFRKAASRITS